MQPKLIVFASGTKDGGGTGFENLARSKELDADIVAVVSNYERGGVYETAHKLGVPFVHFDGADSRMYPDIVAKTGAEWVALSGWMKKVERLNPRATFNIHPALLSLDDGRFGGKGMYGHYIHDAVKAALDAGEIEESGFSMHFVTDEYDRGPVFFEYRVPLSRGMSATEIATAVQEAEHVWQPKVTNMVVHGAISWDGKAAATLVVPKELNLL